MNWLLLLAAQNLVDPSVIARGEKIFAQNCSVGYCHGVAGAAGRGPRLRGRTLDNKYLYKVTHDGIPNSAMPAWKDRLGEEDIRAVVAYVASLATATGEPPATNPMPPGTGPATISPFKGPAQAGRGYVEFFSATRETHCGTCHTVGGRGIGIGPDLARLGAKSPKEIAAAIRGTQSRHVLTAKLSDGEVFPALRSEQTEEQIRLYDLTAPPPVLRSLQRSEIASLTENPGWSHRVIAKDYTAAQLADIIAYIRWASSGETVNVRPSEL